MYIYADNAATTKMSNVALQAMLPYFTETFGNPSSLHSAGQEAKEALEAARATVARCIGCEPRETSTTPCSKRVATEEQSTSPLN